MGKRVFVGNLSFDTSSDQLRSTFEACGIIIDAKVISDRESGRSRGFGFVEFANEQQAAEAIEKFNSTQLNGRAIVVNEAQERSRSGGHGDSGGRGRERRERR